MAQNEAYQRAEKKIEKARRSGAKRLDLSGSWGDEKALKLIELPESLGQLTQLQSLNLSWNQLTALPEWLGQLTQLKSLDLHHNQLTVLPESLGQLTQLQSLKLYRNQLTTLPESLGQLTKLPSLDISDNQLTALPESLSQLTKLRSLNLNENRFGNSFQDAEKCLKLASNLTMLFDLYFSGNRLNEVEDRLGELMNILAQSQNLTTLFLSRNRLTKIPSDISSIRKLSHLSLDENQLVDIPPSLSELSEIRTLDLDGNPLNPELAAAYQEGIDAVKRYLRAKAEAQVALNEAKLILVGEGEVGKSCLLGALRDDPWVEGCPTTHGIEIKPVTVTDADRGVEIKLNGWDFGGQRVYRPTHQLFFTAPAVYLVVWKPREGPQQGFVKEWIKLVKHREPDARILVVATHGGPRERQPDIDRQELWDLFGRETVIDFFTVESKPDTKTGERRGIAVLKEAIARVAAGLPEMGRTVPTRWQAVRETLSGSGEAYLPLERVFAICREHKIEEEDARLLLRICRRVGDLIHFEHDPVLRDIVVLKPDWLATAISFVLDDEQTRKVAHGLVRSERLGWLWNDPRRPAENRYPAKLHPIFLRLMERFDLSYRVAESGEAEPDGTSLIAQLVPDVRPEPVPVWADGPASGDAQQVQVCRIVDSAKNESATAEGLFYQLIVRLHKYSLGRAEYARSVHWQRGLVLEDDTGARAFLEHIGNDVRLTVRSPYPERFLAALTYEVKWLVESFWKGMRCQVTVPCLMRRSSGEPCTGLFEVTKLIENKKRNRPEQPCHICNEWQDIEELLHNAPTARANPMDELLANSEQVKQALGVIFRKIEGQHAEVIGRFDELDANDRELVSKVEATYDGLMHALLDEAKEGPRLFSFVPVEPGFFDRPKWVSAKFRVTLWCEHSRLPLPLLNGEGDRRGVYDLTLPREWLVKAAPALKVITGALGLIAPAAISAAKLTMDTPDFQRIEKQLELGQKCLDALIKGGEKTGPWLVRGDAPDLERGDAITARGADLRQLHAWLKEKDPALAFGGLERVVNKRQEFLWVHPKYVTEY